MKNRLVHSSLALAVGTVLFSTAAMAQIVEPEAVTHYYEDGVLVVSDVHADPFWANSFASGDHGFASAASTSDGALAAWASVGQVGGLNTLLPPAFPAPVGAASALGTAIWETTVQNTTAMALDYSFRFNVVTPYLRTTGAGADFAGMAIDILLNGSSIWSASASLTGSTLVHDAIFGAPMMGPGAHEYVFASFDATAALGVFRPGQEFTLGYYMTAYVDANAARDGYVQASLGDPFSIAGVEFITTEVVGGIPEPATWAMLIAGFGMVGIAIRRRQDALAA